MQRKPGMISVSLLIGLVLFPFFAPMLAAQTSPPPPNAQQLDQLLAPVALYPDALLAQITTASTNPQEILDVTNWLAKNPGLTGPDLTAAAQKQGYDPAFLALVTFPDVLQMMADHIDDYAAIGQAVTANQEDVAASIQRLRAQAYASGALRSNDKQKVEVQQVSNQPIYVIQPANPQVVFVPQYNPTVVYVAPPPNVAAVSLISFGLGIGIGALVYSNQPWGWAGWGWGWGGRGGIYYNRGPWGGVWVGGYRPPVVWYRPRPVQYIGRPGYGGNWGYRPPNYRPPYPTRPPAYRPPGHYPGAPGYRPPVNGGRPVPKPSQPIVRPPGNGNPGTRPPGNGYPGTRPPGNGGQPGTRPPGNGGQPGTRPPGNGGQPGTRPPGGGNPGTRPPGNGGQPSIQPVRPSNPGGGGDRPGGSTPPGGARPAPQTRPAPQGGGQGNPGGGRPDRGQGGGPQPR
jgi:Protein of unknown function (DUF3300)